MKNLRNTSNVIQQNDDVYGDRELAAVPFWYHSVVCLFLSILGILGISLNGFVVWNFVLRRLVSTTMLNSMKDLLYKESINTKINKYYYC